ncbi:putative peptidyl-tRNA hydrolase PTRHD1 isoform X2 [Anabrus simplex]|uniref:putative peptidyl-tRNA hydrolase PTRHD1 isoform X2 n=1 Tax=Anabrus simplex TaxID=316456 RepID=UPI0035A27123
MSRNLVQYVVMRGDLAKKWNVGALIAQACHACCAVTHLFHEDPYTQEYLKDLDSMHKVVLEAPSLESMDELEARLKENNVDHKKWVEQPENFCTCIVLKPYPKEEVEEYFKNFKLFSKRIK